MSRRKAFLLRLSPELHRALERWAADELRSVNAQIEYLLTQAVRRAGRGGTGAPPPAGEPEREEGGPAASPDATGIP